VPDPVPPTPEPEPAAAPAEGVAPIAPPGPEPLDHPERPEGVVVALEGEQRWKPWSSFLALIAGLAGALFGGIAIAIIATAFGSDVKHPTPAVTIAGTVFQDLALLASALLFANMVARPHPWEFGLRRPPHLLKAVGWFVLTYVAFVVFSAAWIAALDMQHAKDTLVNDLGARRSDVALIAAAILVCVVAPICEEFFFRGFFFRALANWKGIWPAAVITGLVFGGIHAGGSPPAFLVPLAFLGFVLCLLYAKTRSLYPCIALHCVNNCFAYGNLVGWDWQIPVAIAASLAVISGGLFLVRRIAGAPPGPAPAIVLARST
jgi:uncharacterized protein